MIIAHFFTRKVKGVLHLYVETTSSNGIVQPSPTAQRLMPVDLSEPRTKWIRDAYYAFVKKYPDLILLDSMENHFRLESDHPSFDLVFKPKPKRVKKKEETPEEILDRSIGHSAEAPSPE